MSDDLISRKTIKSQIETIRDCWGISPFVSSSDMKLYAKTFNVVLRTISDCHTAFDKEKVIEKIKGIMDDESIRFVDQAVNRTIEIVEKGGIE